MSTRTWENLNVVSFILVATLPAAYQMEPEIGQLKALVWQWWFSCYVMSNSLWPHGLQPIRLLSPWDFLDQNAGVGCHFLLQGISLTWESKLHLLPCRWILYHWATREAQRPRERSDFKFKFWASDTSHLPPPHSLSPYRALTVALYPSPPWGPLLQPPCPRSLSPFLFFQILMFICTFLLILLQALHA